MSAQHLTEEELEPILSSTLSCPPEVVAPAGFSCGVWERIDAWEAEQEKAMGSRSILARLMGTRMRNGEPVVVLAAALLFGALFVGLFLTGMYLVAAQSSIFMRVVQIVLGPDLGDLRSLMILFTLTALGGLLLVSLALSEHLFGERNTHRNEPTWSVGGGSPA
ncbi:MAG: hypothetical protein ACYDH4_04445 [Candidatus Cryosericum sp.]